MSGSSIRLFRAASAVALLSLTLILRAQADARSQRRINEIAASVLTGYLSLEETSAEPKLEARNARGVLHMAERLKAATLGAASMERLRDEIKLSDNSVSNEARRKRILVYSRDLSRQLKTLETLDKRKAPSADIKIALQGVRRTLWSAFTELRDLRP
jgi:hypothetical protein